MDYHPDPEIDAEIRADAATGAAADLAAGLRVQTCPKCGRSHSRGWIDGHSAFRCLHCGEVFSPAARVAVAASLAFALLAAGCANFAATASLTLVTAEEAGKLAATLGADAYKVENDLVTAELKALTGEAIAKRAELGCGTTESPASLPATCDRIGWKDFGDTIRPKIEALEARGTANDERFETLEKVLATHASALALAARAVLVYVKAKEKGSSPSIAGLIAEVLAAYATITEALALWDIKVPGVPGL